MMKVTIQVMESSIAYYTIEANSVHEAQEMFENRLANDETFESFINRDLECGFQGREISVIEEDMPDDATLDFTYDEMKGAE